METFTTGNWEFAISQLFAICQLMAKNVFAICLQKTYGKELTDGKEHGCHQPILCHLLVDGK